MRDLSIGAFTERSDRIRHVPILKDDIGWGPVDENGLGQVG